MAMNLNDRCPCTGLPHGLDMDETGIECRDCLNRDWIKSENALIKIKILKRILQHLKDTKAPIELINELKNAIE